MILLKIDFWIAIKDYVLEVLPVTPEWNQIFSFLYKNRIKEDDVVSPSETGFSFQDILERFPLSQQELLNVKSSRSLELMKLVFTGNQCL